jgi:hypothetical protein
LDLCAKSGARWNLPTNRVMDNSTGNAVSRMMGGQRITISRQRREAAKAQSKNAERLCHSGHDFRASVPRCAVRKRFPSLRKPRAEKILAVSFL